MSGYRGAPSLVGVYRSSPSSADDDQSPLSPDRNHWSSPNPGNEYPSSPSSVATTRAIPVRSATIYGTFNSASDYCSSPSLAAYAALRSVGDHWSSPRSVGCPAQLVTLSALTSWSDAIIYPVKLSLVVTHLLPSELSQLRQRIPEPSQLRRRTPSSSSPVATAGSLPAQSARNSSPNSGRDHQSSPRSVGDYRSSPQLSKGTTGAYQPGQRRLELARLSPRLQEPSQLGQGLTELSHPFCAYQSSSSSVS